jgi:MarR family 2-MHQ and catechol resistance regulon transcriptional repressor
VLDKLEARGLLRRRRDHDDRRVVRAELTARGDALVAELMPRHARRVAAAFAVLAPDEQVQLARLLRTLGRAQSDRPDERSPLATPTSTGPARKEIP